MFKIGTSPLYCIHSEACMLTLIGGKKQIFQAWDKTLKLYKKLLNYFQSHLDIKMQIEFWFEMLPCFLLRAQLIFSPYPSLLWGSVWADEKFTMNGMPVSSLSHHGMLCFIPAMFRMKDREIALGGPFVENSCYEKIWWADSDVSVSWSPVFVLSLGLDAHAVFSNKVTHIATIHKLITVLMDPTLRFAGDSGSGSAKGWAESRYHKSAYSNGAFPLVGSAPLGYSCFFPHSHWGE